MASHSPPTDDYRVALLGGLAARRRCPIRAPHESGAADCGSADRGISKGPLRIGECVSLSQIPTGPLSLDTPLSVVSCPQPHNAQVVAILHSSNSTYTGLSNLTQQAQQECLPAAVSFLGTGKSKLELMAIVPGAQSWSQGDRTESCLLVDAFGTIAGDLQTAK
jgi:hypothetical protein